MNWKLTENQQRIAMFAAGLVLLVSTATCAAQMQDAASSGSGAAVASAADLPEAPIPLVGVVKDDPQTQQPSSSQQQAPQSSSSAQGTASQTDADKSAHDKAEEQLKQQEKQRVMGVMATFNTTSNRDALPLSPGQKFRLFFKSETDPWPFLLSSVVAGIGQADDSYPEWGQGMQGYAKRFGAAYSDAFIGNFFGNAIFPIVLKEDPRYFQKGTGKPWKRFLWAASSTVWCRRDNGKWGPNYANVGGNLVGAAIARAYYPASDRTVSDTITDGLTVSAEGVVGAEVIEFWPDLVRRHKRKQAEKQAREEAEQVAKESKKPADAPAGPPATPQP
ncbi:MAG TPA: hypothetical protein VK716_17955 [Terracidiphilus sp.]|jgi:hypothetical protein|nr:hypothetical protein [Terracidiphilus sp.]